MTLTDWEQLLEYAGKENPNPVLRSRYMATMKHLEDNELVDLVACGLVHISARMTINPGSGANVSDEIKYYAMKKVISHLDKSIDNWREQRRNG